MLPRCPPPLPRRPNVLHSLLRTFDKQIHSVRRRIPSANSGQFDLYPANDQAVKYEKLRSNIERLHPVLVTVSFCLQEIDKLRSYEHVMRSSAWCSIYFIAWYNYSIFHLSLIVILLLVLSPTARGIMFPTHPTDLMRCKSESEIEIEAQRFVENAATLAAVVAGIQSEEEALVASMQSELALGDDVQPKPDATETVEEREEFTESSEDFKDIAAEEAKTSRHLLILQSTSGMLADLVEQVANVLAPALLPFELLHARLKISACVIILFLFLRFFPTHLLSFLVGFVFFGQPFFDSLPPSIGDGGHGPSGMQFWFSIPTNAQLTLRLLRDAELSLNPLPPPPLISSLSPYSVAGGPTVPADGKFSQFVGKASRMTEHASGYVSGRNKKKWSDLYNTAANQLHLRMGVTVPPLLLNIPSSQVGSETSNSMFYAHYSNTPGHLTLRSPTPDSRPTLIEFTPFPSNAATFTCALDSLISIRKTARIGWKSRIGLDYALASTGPCGLEISFFPLCAKVHKGEERERGRELEEGLEQTVKFQVVLRRNELFNRLIALAPLDWESR